MNVTREWLHTLAAKYGVKPKVISESLWPKATNKGLSYFDKTKNPGVQYIETIADVLQCSVDEILRRPMPASHQMVSGDNNQIGNITITNDVGTLQQIIIIQNKIIERQDDEIERLNENMKDQLKQKDEQIDRLIKMAQEKG